MSYELITLTDDEVPTSGEDADVQPFIVDEPADIVHSDGVGHDATIWQVEHFIAMSVEDTITPSDDDIPDELKEAMTTEIDESAVFISNDEWAVGMGVIRLDGGTLTDALEQFVEQLDDEHNILTVYEDDLQPQGADDDE